MANWFSTSILKNKSMGGKMVFLTNSIGTSGCCCLWPLGLQHARPPCPSPSPRICPSSCSLHCIGDAILLSHPLMPSSPSALSFSQDFSNESSVHIKWAKYWSFSFSISPSSEYSGSISLKIDWFDLLAVQGTFRSLLQHCSSKASILLCSPFFTVQLSQPYVTTGKTIALNIRTFVGNVSAFQHTV